MTQGSGGLASGTLYTPGMDLSSVPYGYTFVGVDPETRRIFYWASGSYFDELRSRFPGKDAYLLDPQTSTPGLDAEVERENPVGIEENHLGIDYWPFFLGYNNEVSLEPVNQIPYLEGYHEADWDHLVIGGWPSRGPRVKGFFEHVCGFAHELSILPSHTYQHLNHNDLDLLPDDPHNDESNLRWKTLWKYARASVGFCFKTLEGWADDPPTETLWEARLPGIRNTMRWLCWQCDHPYWARKMLIEMDPALWQAAMTPVSEERGQGTSHPYTSYEVKLPRVNPETMNPHPTGTHFFVSHETAYDPTGPWRSWTSGYRKALQRYDEKYAHRS